jgi:hypothetical protein
VPGFEIRYLDLQHDPSRRVKFHVFHVRCGDTEAILPVGLSDLVRRQWRLDSRENAQEVERRVVVARVKEHLARVTELAAHRILLTARDAPDLGKDWTVRLAPEEPPYERKECKHRLEKQGEHYCSVAEEGDGWGGRTTLANCEDCGLPSTDIACGNLVHPCTVSSRAFGQPWTRQLCDVHCQLGRAVSEASAVECVPGGRDCWVQTYEVEEAAAVGSAVAGFSIAEAIDQVNAALRSRYGRKLIVIEHARSIEDLAGDCGTDDSLQHKLQVLAGLLEGMQLSGLLTEQEQEGSQGTIDLLERLVARDFPTLPLQYVRNLRNINKLAAGYPRHAKVKNMERAHAELGLPYPVTDYAKAWAIVKETFVQTLRQLALHLS